MAHMSVGRSSSSACPGDFLSRRESGWLRASLCGQSGYLANPRPCGRRTMVAKVSPEPGPSQKPERVLSSVVKAPSSRTTRRSSGSQASSSNPRRGRNRATSPFAGRSLLAVTITELPDMATELIVMLPLPERSSKPRPSTHSGMAGASKDVSQFKGGSHPCGLGNSDECRAHGAFTVTRAGRE